MRLTNAIKDQILTAVMKKAGIEKEAQDLTNARADWAERARIMSLGAPEEEIEATIKEMRKLFLSLPENIRGYMNIQGYQSTYIRVVVAGQYYAAYYNGKFESTAPHTQKLTNQTGITFDAGHEMAIKWESLMQRGRDLKQRELDLRTEVMAILNSVTTTKKLIEIWPEAIELVPPATTKPKQLPAVQVDALNKTLGLPTPGLLYEPE